MITDFILRSHVLKTWYSMVNIHIVLKFDRHPSSTAAEMPVRFQCNWKPLCRNLLAVKLQETLEYMPQLHTWWLEAPGSLCYGTCMTREHHRHAKHATGETSTVKAPLTMSDTDQSLHRKHGVSSHVTVSYLCDLSFLAYICHALCNIGLWCMGIKADSCPELLLQPFHIWYDDTSWLDT